MPRFSAKRAVRGRANVLNVFLYVCCSGEVDVGWARQFIAQFYIERARRTVWSVLPGCVAWLARRATTTLAPPHTCLGGPDGRASLSHGRHSLHRQFSACLGRLPNSRTRSSRLLLSSLRVFYQAAFRRLSLTSPVERALLPIDLSCCAGAYVLPPREIVWRWKAYVWQSRLSA